MKGLARLNTIFDALLIFNGQRFVLMLMHFGKVRRPN